MMFESIQAHTIDGCTTAEQIFAFFIEQIACFEIEGERVTYTQYRRNPETREVKTTDIYQTNVYEISARDLDISNIRKAYTCNFHDDEFSIIETKNNRVHILNDREFDVSEGTIYEIILNANGVKTGWVSLTPY